MVSLFWLSFIASRLITAYLFDRVLSRNSEVWSMLFLSGAATVALFNLISLDRRLNALIGWPLLGLFLGPILMAIGGALSLSDRRLRIAAGRRRAATAAGLAPAE